jgi:hypothetical protein
MPQALYLTDDFPDKWSYQIDIFMEVDTAFVNFHDPSDSTNMPNTIAYVNALVTASSAVYEKEIDTHCEHILCRMPFMIPCPFDISLLVHVISYCSACYPHQEDFPL